jgi:methanogenic corrinoid protein MtbC1
MIAALATAEGWAVTYLGADLPAKDVARAAEETGARGVALSIIHPAGDPKISAQLRSLRDALPHGVSLIVGGQASESYTAALDSPSCDRPKLNRFADTLRSIE